jgi:hypothetical protein
MSHGAANVTLPPNKKMREGENVGGVTMPPEGRNVGGVTMPPSDRNVGGVTMPPPDRNVGGVTMPPPDRNVGGVTMPPPDRNVGGVTMPPPDRNVGGVTMPPANRNVGGVTIMPPADRNTAGTTDSENEASAAAVGVAMPPKWHTFAKLQARGTADKMAREEDKDVHPDDAIILRKISDPVERMRVAKKLRKRRKKMYRDRDFGGAGLVRGKSTKLLIQGRHTTRTDLSANNTLTQLEAAKTRVLPGASIPTEVAQQLELDRAREEAAQTRLEMAEAGMHVDDGDTSTGAVTFQVGDIDPATGKELDINDIELMKIRAEQERLKPLLAKEERHNRTGGRQCVGDFVFVSRICVLLCALLCCLMVLLFVGGGCGGGGW